MYKEFRHSLKRLRNVAQHQRLRLKFHNYMAPLLRDMTLENITLTRVIGDWPKRAEMKVSINISTV